MRLLPIQRIPLELWQNGLLRIPAHLNTAYVGHLHWLGLLNNSTDISESEVYGGDTLEQTHDHFAKRFAVSAGRTEYSVLGPCDDFESLSEAFLSTFSDGHVALLDIPCGTGAMSCALIATLTKLRANNVVPRLPLTISICAGDYSPEALRICASMLTELVVPASAQGITIHWETNEWNAIRSDQTARLIDRWFAISPNATEHFVVVSNFSGALHNAGTFESFSPCLEHVLARLHDRQSTVVWIEPATNSARRGLFIRLLDLVTRRIGWFSNRSSATSQSFIEARYRIEHPLNRTEIPTTVAVNRFERT
jgi:hypothetical protein